MTISLPEILLALLLLFRPLGAAAETLRLAQRAERSPASSSSSTQMGAKAADAASKADDDADDDDDDDGDDDDADAPPAANADAHGHASAKAAAADQADDDADDDDDDDDEDDGDDDYDYEDVVDMAGAQEDSGKAISGNVTLASDYILRGLTQTDHQPAVQGGFDYTHPTGFYLGLWGSNVHFIDELPSLELDSYGGYTYHLDKDWRFSLGIDYLAYFQEEGRNSWDFPARAEWKTFSLEVTYSPDWAGLGGASWYFLGGWSDTLVWDLTFGAYVGFSTFSADADAPDYWDFRVSVSKRYLGVDWGLAGIFVSDEEINDANGGPRAIFSLTKAF